jgi:Rad3-related DNA helicase
MTDYKKLFKALSDLHNTWEEPQMVPAVPTFPYKEMYSEQRRIYDEMVGQKESALCSHTGFGKTPLYLSLIRGQSSLVISPRKFLQKQVANYAGDFILFGRSEYPCLYAPSAATSPCQRKLTCDATDYHKLCEDATQDCLEHPCRVFASGSKHRKYPCNGCQYIHAQGEAAKTLKNKGTVICNFGNFFNLLKYSDLVVVDEADLFFRELSKPTRMIYTTPNNVGEL